MTSCIVRKFPTTTVSRSKCPHVCRSVVGVDGLVEQQSSKGGLHVPGEWLTASVYSVCSRFPRTVWCGQQSSCWLYTGNPSINNFHRQKRQHHTDYTCRCISTYQWYHVWTVTELELVLPHTGCAHTGCREGAPAYSYFEVPLQVVET